MDTLAVNFLTDKSLFPEIIKLLIPGVFIFVAAYLAFRYGLKKDRIINEEKESHRLQKLKYFVHYSISKLIEPSESQLNYIEKFMQQFKSDDLDIESIRLSSPFYEDNFSWIPSIDIYDIFINMSKKPMEEKSKALSNFKYCMKVNNQISENLESDMNKYRDRVNELGYIYNKISSEIRNEINEIIKRGNNWEFMDEFNLLREHKLKQEKLTDFHYMFNEFYVPLLTLVEKHRVFSLIQIIPEIKNINYQFQGLKSQYYNIYRIFAEQLRSSIITLKEIKMFLEE